MVREHTLLLNTLRYVLPPRMQSVLATIPWVLEKDVCSAVLCGVLCVYLLDLVGG